MQTIKNNFLAIACIFFINALYAQAPLTNPVQDISYTYIQSDGTNASAVVWIPDLQIYVTAIAGNEGFPLEGFNTKGENVFTAVCNIDVRGMWWNPSAKKIETNNAGEIGWSGFSIEANRPTFPEVIFTGQNQPDFQSIGTFDAAKKKVVFLDIANGGIKMYKRLKPKKTSTLSISWGAVSPSNINMYSMGVTGHTGYEYVLLDYANRNLVFYNSKGALAATVQLPRTAPVNDTFAFSYTNDRIFLYDKTNRIWYGYKIF